MPILIQCEGLRYNSCPVIWMKADVTPTTHITQKAILVAVRKNQKSGYSIEHIPKNLTNHKKMFQETLAAYARAKKVEIDAPLITLKSKDEIKQYQKYFKEQLPSFEGKTLVIEDLAKVTEILQTIRELESTEKKKIILRADPKLPNTTMPEMASSSRSPSSYTQTTQHLQRPPAPQEVNVEFNELNIKWVRTTQDRVVFKSQDTKQVGEIVTHIHKTMYKDGKTKPTTQLEQYFQTMLSESTPYALTCSESMLRTLYGYKTDKQSGLQYLSQLNLVKQQELLLKSFAQAQQQTKVTGDLSGTLKYYNHQLTNKNIPILFKFERMENPVAWCSSTNAKWFIIGSEIDVNAVCLEIIAKIEKTYLSQIERNNKINELYQGTQPQSDGALKFEVSHALLQCLFGQPKLFTLKTEVPQKRIQNNEKKMTSQEFTDTILAKLVESLNVFNKAHQRQILSKIANPKENPLANLIAEAEKMITNCTDEIRNSITELRDYLTSRNYSAAINLDKDTVITTTYAFLNSKIFQLDNHLKADTSLKLIQEKFYQKDKNLVIKLPFYSDTTKTSPLSHKRKFEEEGPQLKSTHRKLIPGQSLDVSYDSGMSITQAGESGLTTDLENDDSSSSLDDLVSRFLN